MKKQNLKIIAAVLCGCMLTACGGVKTELPAAPTQPTQEVTEAWEEDPTQESVTEEVTDPTEEMTTEPMEVETDAPTEEPTKSTEVPTNSVEVPTDSIEVPTEAPKDPPIVIIQPGTPTEPPSQGQDAEDAPVDNSANQLPALDDD